MLRINDYETSDMRFLILGRGKTGAIVAEVAHERHHHVQVMTAADNPRGTGLTPERLQGVDVVIDFTAPSAALPNIEACLALPVKMVVGTTGWYEHLGAIREQVERAGTGFLYGANFSIGVNLFFDAARSMAQAGRHDYHSQIFERHHQHKKDAPSGTALVLKNIVQESSGKEVEITSFREGEVIGLHELVFDSPHDRLYLCHDAKSRRGFADGAVRAAEWLSSQRGFFDFKDVWRELA
jgi:4-hydroxy-tetrahydrodipicolinate reductase